MEFNTNIDVKYIATMLQDMEGNESHFCKSSYIFYKTIQYWLCKSCDKLRMQIIVPRAITNIIQKAKLKVKKNIKKNVKNI